MLARFRLLFHTLRFLRWEQLLGRVWIRVPRRVPQGELLPLREAGDTWESPQGRVASFQPPHTFTFLGQARRVADATSWNDATVPKLWLYNLHYFDDLNAGNPAMREDAHRELCDRWIQENPPAEGNGWEPYPVSLRVVNWIKWAQSGRPVDSRWRLSLVQQVRWLRKHLEYHLLGNHLFANAKALLFAGAFFDGDEAEAWRTKGLQLLRQELQEQFLGDGGHFERSPMYHAILLEDVLDLLQLAKVYPGLIEPSDLASWREVAERGTKWLMAMLHPDEQLSLFNDCALNIALPPKSLFTYACHVGAPCPKHVDSVFLGDSGYVRLTAVEATLLLDAAPVGPDYLPGHAHADTLSFELSLGRSRLLVNTGTSVYGTGDKRLYQRGTAAHNTVVVDETDSSEVWGGFRVARRAYPRSLQVDLAGGRVACAHDGYRRLPGKVLHHRSWHLEASGLEVVDQLEGNWQSAVACLHLHPDVEASVKVWVRKSVPLASICRPFS